MAGTAVAATLLATAAMGGAQVYQAEQQKKAAKEQIKMQKDAAAKQEAELTERKANEEKTALRNRQLADIRRRSSMMGFGSARGATESVIGGSLGQTLLGA